MAVHEEARAALGSLTALGPSERASPAAMAGGLAFYPLVGLLVGAAAATLAALAGRFAPTTAALAAILALSAFTGIRNAIALASLPGANASPLLRAAATATEVAAVAARLAALIALRPPTRTAALMVAPMLGAWAIVVQCYGGTPAAANDPAAPIIARARFREFGWASLTAIGLTLAIGDAVGLLLVVVAASLTLAIRLYAHRHPGHLTAPLLAATRELVETITLVTLGLLTLLAN